MVGSRLYLLPRRIRPTDIFAGTMDRQPPRSSSRQRAKQARLRSEWYIHCFPLARTIRSSGCSGHFYGSARRASVYRCELYAMDPLCEANLQSRCYQLFVCGCTKPKHLTALFDSVYILIRHAWILCAPDKSSRFEEGNGRSVEVSECLEDGGMSTSSGIPWRRGERDSNLVNTELGIEVSSQRIQCQARRRRVAKSRNVTSRHPMHSLVSPTSPLRASTADRKQHA